MLQVGRVLFRLHKFILIVQSPFFRALFAHGFQPPKRYDTADGAVLPLYKLTIDGLHVNDLERLLEILENPL